MWCVRHNLLAVEDAGFDELANLMMADTELCGGIAQRQPLATLLGRAVAVRGQADPVPVQGEGRSRAKPRGLRFGRPPKLAPTNSVKRFSGLLMASRRWM
jgi:hypothetical protein